VIWQSLWDLCYDGEMPAREYIETSLETLKSKSRASVVRSVISNIKSAVMFYLPGSGRLDYQTAVADQFWTLAKHAKPGSDAQFQFMLAFADLAVTPAQGDILRGLIEGTVSLEGITIEKGLVWSLLNGLIRIGLAGQKEIDEAYGKDQTADGWAAKLRAEATVPTPEAKRRVLETIAGDTEQSNSNTYARFAGDGFADLSDPALVEPLIDAYFKALVDVFNTKSFKVSEYFVDDLYPRLVATPELLHAGEQWLSSTDAPAALKRIVAEHVDDTRRDLRNQAVA
jgi:aminopeptidase N